MGGERERGRDERKEKLTDQRKDTLPLEVCISDLLHSYNGEARRHDRSS